MSRALLFASIGLVCGSAWAQVVTEFSAGITNGAAVVAITQGPDGKKWFTEEGVDKIGRITTTSVLTGEFSTGMTAGAGPRRITSGLDGNLWFAEFGIDRIGRIPTSGNTQVASNVNVDLNGGASTPGGVSISFAQVTGAGDTAGTTSSSCPAVSSGFSLGTPAVCYDLKTTALFTPPVQACINYSSVSFPSGQPALLHDEVGTWVDVTTSRDTTNHVVCGNLNSLSPFVVAVKVNVLARPNAPIPTLSHWGMITLAMPIVLLAARHVRMRRH